MAYASWSVVFSEQPSAAKWNILGTNDASFNNGTGLPVGSCVQTVYTMYSAVATGSTTIPYDDTIPQKTEGDQYMTQAITPRSATNLLYIEARLVLSSAAPRLMAALFQDATSNALAGTISYQATAGGEVNMLIQHVMVAGTTSSTTFNVRAGAASAGTTTFNGASSARIFGAIPKSSIIIREYTA